MSAGPLTPTLVRRPASAIRLGLRKSGRQSKHVAATVHFTKARALAAGYECLSAKEETRKHDTAELRRPLPAPTQAPAPLTN